MAVRKQTRGGSAALDVGKDEQTFSVDIESWSRHWNYDGTTFIEATIISVLITFYQILKCKWTIRLPNFTFIDQSEFAPLSSSKTCRICKHFFLKYTHELDKTLEILFLHTKTLSKARENFFNWLECAKYAEQLVNGHFLFDI